MLAIAKYWAPPILWASLILVFSTAGFSSESTSRFFLPFFRWMFPAGAVFIIDGLHFLVRKLGHWSEYFILALLVYRACRQGQEPRWQFGGAVWTLSFVLFFSIADETYQTFVPNRNGVWNDCLLDFCGGACAMAVLYAWGRSKISRLGTPARVNP